MPFLFQLDDISGPPLASRQFSVWARPIAQFHQPNVKCPFFSSSTTSQALLWRHDVYHSHRTAAAAAAAMWRGGATAASAARYLRSRILPDPLHYPVISLVPVTSARASSSIPSVAASNPVAEAAAAAAAVSQQSGSASDALHHYGRCYWELSKARLRCADYPLSSICICWLRKHAVLA
jgi:hypothetical protein